MSLYPADFTEQVISMMSGSFRNSNGEVMETAEVLERYKATTGRRTRQVFIEREKLLQEFSEVKNKADLAFCLRKSGKYWDKVLSLMDQPQSNENVIVSFYVCMVLNKEINDSITAAIDYLMDSEDLNSGDLKRLSKNDRVKDLLQ